jgi:hypothetical protein
LRWSNEQVITRHTNVLHSIKLWQDVVDNIGGLNMNGSLQYMLVQKVAEAEHQQRVADGLARAAQNGYAPRRAFRLPRLDIARWLRVRAPQPSLAADPMESCATC